MKRNYDYLLRPQVCRARRLGQILMRAIGIFRSQGVADPHAQELWSLLRQVTPLVLPGPLPGEPEMRAQIDEIQRSLIRACERAGVAVRVGPVETERARALRAEQGRLERDLVDHVRVAENEGWVEEWNSLIEERMEITARLVRVETEVISGEELEGILRIDLEDG